MWAVWEAERHMKRSPSDNGCHFWRSLRGQGSRYCAACENNALMHSTAQLRPGYISPRKALRLAMMYAVPS